jgi:transcriptional regulator with XRE-family HTH domain
MQMADKHLEQPYKLLGNRLRGMRERLRETVAEVSGAVEIDVEALADIEQGQSRPSEEILLLLISHFAVKEDEATKLWELAGYEQPDGETSNMSLDSFGTIKNAVVVMPVDTRVIYTDMAHVMVNNHGVVMNFMQGTPNGGQPTVVSRLGMSREHAQSLLELLNRTLAQQQQTQVPKSLKQPEPTKEDSPQKDA